MISDRMGEILRDGERLALTYERRLAHPPEKVWRALTESANLRQWFPADIVGDRTAGARVRLPFWPESVEKAGAELEAAGVDLDDAELPGEIRSWDPPRLFELVWGDPEREDSEFLRFQLEADGPGTILVFTTWLGEPGPAGHAGTAAGYEFCLNALEALLDTGVGVEPDERTAQTLQDAYAERLAAVDEA